MARSGAGEEVPFIQSLSLQWVQALASCGVGALGGGAGVGCGAGKSRVRKQDEDSERRCWVRMLGADEGGSDDRRAPKARKDSGLQACYSQALRDLHISRYRPVRSGGLHSLILTAHQGLFLPLQAGG